MTKKTDVKLTHLQPATRRWLEYIRTKFVLQSHHLRVLVTACEMWDRSQQALEAIREHGLLIQDRFGGLKKNLAVETERSSKTLFLKAVCQLGLEDELPVEGLSKPNSLTATFLG